jgi:hypothetical protein
MTASDPNFFILVVLGGAMLYGLAPAYGAFALALAGLWVLGKAPIIFFLLAGAWLARRLVFDFMLAWFAGLGFGIGAQGGSYRLRQRMPRERVQRFRRPPRGYQPNDAYPDPQDDWPENLK